MGRQGTPALPDVVFVDRSLGKDIVAGLQDAGYPRVLHMSDVYPDDGQHVGDDDWIMRCGEAAWVAFSKDANVVRAHHDAIRASGIRIFLLPDQQMRGRDQIARFVDNRYRIAQKAKKPGPRVFKVHPRDVKQIWP